MTDAQMASVIRRITDGLTRVAPLGRVSMRAARWAVLAVLSILSVTWLVGPRRDLLSVAPTFVVQVVFMAAMAAIGAVAANQETK